MTDTPEGETVIVELCRRLDVSLPDVDPAQTLDDTELDLLAQGKKIQAIAHLRERTGAGLVEAKQIVEQD